MWEAVRANKRRSLVLVIVMAAVLFALGIAIGEAIAPRGGGIIGFAAALGLWLIMSAISYFQGGKLLMAASGAQKIQKEDHPQLFNIVEEMQIAAGLDKMPDVYIIDDLSPNAFATGRDPDHAAVAVTTGLLSKLNRDQLQGVIAHEMSHIVNRDVLFMTMIGVMVGSVVLLSEVFLRSMFWSGGRAGRSRSRSSGGNNQGQIIMVLIALVMAILAPILAQVIYFAASRRREYLADANAVVLTRYPEGLASALEVISSDTRPLARANKATAPMYIDNPYKRHAGRAAQGLFSTHPPTDERVRILRGMTNAASFQEYQQAWNRVGGGKAGSLPASALTAEPAGAIRGPQAESRGVQESRQEFRKAHDVIRRLHGFAMVPCSCGAKIKIPPGFRHDAVRCPRCGQTHALRAAG